MTKSRRQEAEKSILVQVSSANSYAELLNYCSKFGEVKSAFHYQVPSADTNFILLEFQEVSECAAVLRDCQFSCENPGIPVVSPFVWFKAVNKKKSAAKLETSSTVLNSQNTKLPDNDSLNEILRTAGSLDDQMMVFYKLTGLTDLGVRTRFLAARQLETALKGIFPGVQSHPFGSSVNGFGKAGCDLDLILRFQDDRKPASNARLIFHTKQNLSNERSQTQRQMEVIGDILHLFLPGVSNVRRILQARVPIIKFNHECLDLEVDLSMSNLTGLYMSELLYLFGEIDDRVRPLTSIIRKWAQVCGLTNPSPGPWITNFSLTCLVLFFLQTLNKPILPSMKQLVKEASEDDIRVTDDSINCTFLRDIKKLKFQTDNNDKLSFLLKQFFEFYSQFDFKNRAVSLIEGTSTIKPEHSAMWIMNPFEPFLNVSKNVSFEEVERLGLETRNAGWVLESSDAKTDEYFWGLLKLFNSSKHAIVKPQMFFKSRLVDVSDLFGETNDGNATVSYKNNQLKNEVKAIRQATKKIINKNEYFAVAKFKRK